LFVHKAKGIASGGPELLDNESVSGALSAPLEYYSDSPLDHS